MEILVKKEWQAPVVEEIKTEVIRQEGTFADDPNFDLRTGSSGTV
jgi:hypothetical protein